MFRRVIASTLLDNCRILGPEVPGKYQPLGLKRCLVSRHLRQGHQAKFGRQRPLQRSEKLSSTLENKKNSPTMASRT